MERRHFNKAMAATLLGGPGLRFSGPGNDTRPSYEEIVADTWRHSGPGIDKREEIMRELVRYATLAANSHNTQPWKFQIGGDRITLLPDLSRRCPAVDPEDHHLYTSLGCATENLVLAASAHGLKADVSIEDTSSSVLIDLYPTVPSRSLLFQAIPKRQSTRTGYDGKRVPTNQLDALVGSAQDEKVIAKVFTDKHDLENILEYVVAGNTAQMEDPTFVKELKKWIRFSERNAVRYRDGLFTASSGNPKLPEWLGGFMFNLAYKTDTENDRYRDQIRSSSGSMVFVCQQNDIEGLIDLGRCYQRFALRSTVFGLRHSFINQAVEVPEIRKQFAKYLGLGDRLPDLLVRFGYGSRLPRSLRRPIEQVIV